MEWIYVILGGLIEIIWVMGLKYADGPYSWIGVTAAIILSFLLLFRSFKKLPIGTVYAVFTGIGTAGIVLVEILLFEEPVSVVKLVFIALLFLGVVGLKWVTEEQSPKMEDQ